MRYSQFTSCTSEQFWLCYILLCVSTEIVKDFFFHFGEFQPMRLRSIGRTNFFSVFLAKYKKQMITTLSPQLASRRYLFSQVPQPFNIIYLELELSWPENFWLNSVKMILTFELLTKLKRENLNVHLCTRQQSNRLWPPPMKSHRFGRWMRFVWMVMIKGNIL